MKKLFVAAIALLFINSLDAQVRFGIKAGGNLANIQGLNKGKAILGLNVGPVLQCDIVKSLFVQSELLYSLKGGQSTATPSDENAIIHLNYLNAPILVCFRATENLSINLGAEIAFLISGKTKFQGNSNDFSDFYKDFDFGADVGAAYTLKKIAFDLRYNYGLTGLVKQNILGSQSKGSNRVLQFSLCYFLK